VPAGAHAGQLTLKRCTYATERGSYTADCGTLVVPENRHDPRSRLIALPVTRIHARSAHPGVPIFRLEGGPGLTNMKFKDASRFAVTRDVVLVGYRGVDGSVRLDCPEVESALKRSADFLGRKSFDAYAHAYRSCANRLQANGVDLAGYSLPERVDDLEAARRALGYHRVDLLSESAGTRTAMIYAWRYPKSIDRSVMIGVNPPGNYLWYPKTTDEQIRKYAALCAKDASCSKRTDDLAATLRTISADIPDHWWFLPIKKGNVRVGSFFGLMSSTSAASPISAPMTLDSWLAAAKGDASGLWLLSTISQLVFPTVQVKGDVAAVSRADAAFAERYYATARDRGSILGGPGTDFLWAGGRLRTAWPAGPDDDQYSHVRTSQVPTLLIGGNLDFATPPQNTTRELLPHLPNGHQVVLPNLGHTDDFWSYEPAASSHLVNTFFADGKVDDSRYTNRPVDFTPGVTQTALAKIILGVMVGFATVAGLSLLWLPRRVHKRGRLGRTASASIRSLYAPVLGLGGWFAGALVVLTTLPTVPLDSDLVAGLSVGLPVGLGIYWAWVRREWSSRTKGTGLAATLAGALVGAWLGCNATTGLFAVLTATIGATVGANLILLVLDLARDRSVRGLAVATPQQVVATVEARAMQHSNLAARMGRWSADHWKTATFGWLALMVAALAVGGQVGTKNVDPNTSGPGESGRMDRILDAGFKQPAGESVLIQSRSVRAGAPVFDSAVEDVVARVSKVAAVQNVRSPLDPGRAGQIAKDGHAALVEFEIRGDKAKAGDKIGPVLNSVADAQRAHPGFFIGEFGDASSVKAVDTAFADDFKSAGLFSVPLTLVILVVAFGALVAAGIPLLLALTAVFATFGLIALPSHLLPIADQASAVVLLIGLAVGVDYSMFYLRREREERAAGRSERAALEAAAATSGRSVLISGLTVMVAMAGMFLTSDATFASIGLATMIVVAVAMLGSLTVLPALLSKLGDKVDRLRVPLVGRLRRDDGEGRIWGAIVDRVLHRPLLSAVLAGGLLLALAAPALQLRIATPGPDTFPPSLDVVKTYNRMQQAFPGTALPANVVVRAPSVNAPAVREAIDRLEQRALASGRMHEPITVDVNKDATVANITVPIDGNGTDAASHASLGVLRDMIVPETVGALPDTEAGVTGVTAEWKDGQDQMTSKLPLVVGFVLLFAFGLMLVAFRSIVVAVKAIVLNLLSVAAAYGVLVLVFQHGVGKGLLGFGSTAGIDPVVPMLLFVILFGLSMDYHVLIVSRIREAFDRGASMDDAIAQGIKSTAGVVTSAAVVMVAVFSIFATLSMLMFKQAGVGLAAAILIDATIVRGVLLPATMKLLGEWNWYLPRWLKWLPRIELEEPSTAPEAKPAPASA
jgi:RND superfamily putative drug exporter